METCSVATGIWLAFWSSANITTHAQRDFYLIGYGSIGAGQALFSLLYALMLLLGAIRASRTLHRKLITNILRLPMTFFDTTPLGRIMNRLSKDIYGIDVKIPMSLRSFLAMFFDVLGMLVAVSYATPLFLSVVPPLGALYFYIQVGTQYDVRITFVLFHSGRHAIRAYYRCTFSFSKRAIRAYFLCTFTFT